MPIFMHEFNPPQIFYVRFMRVIFVVEVIRVEEATKKKPAKRALFFTSLLDPYAANTQQYCKPRQPLESTFNGDSISLLTILSTDLFAALSNTLW